MLQPPSVQGSPPPHLSAGCNTDDRTGLGLSPLQQSASVTQSSSGFPRHESAELMCTHLSSEE